jgi:site-specific recombinase XerC
VGAGGCDAPGYPTKGIDDGTLNAHHNPMQPFRQPLRRAAYQPKEPRPAPRSIPDQAFNELFAGLTSNRDRALIAFYISTGARAAELLGVVQGLLAPEDQTIGVIRKGSQALQHSVSCPITRNCSPCAANSRR